MNRKVTFLAFIVFFFYTIKSISQVGIGTTTPDTSSILDITSTTQGLLTPRMTSTERINITTPAEGLLVYDITEASFYYWDSTTWVKVLANTATAQPIRDNYKIVKNITDLADELTAGGGTKYLLNTDYLYEINGTVTFDYTIDLNGANLIGRDTGEDVLVNNSGGALFSGMNGGRLKDLLINGGGNDIFNITSDASQSIVGYSIIITNASSLGTLSNFSVAFFEVLQVVNTNNGFNLSNIYSLFINKVFWTESNTGTFLNLSGTFQNLQIANGRAAIDTGEFGIDVSLDPTIGTSASLTGINFTGDGDRVVPYTSGAYSGYNFTNSWDVDCQGIPQETDNNAIGDYNLSFNTGTGANTNYSGSGIPVKISGNTSTNNLFRFSEDGENRLVYEGKRTRYFTVTASISFRGVANNDVLLFYVAKGNNGDTVASPLLETATAREIGGNFDIGAVAVVGTVELAPGDFVEMWTERDSGSGSNVYIASLNMVIR
ncbi:cell wall anchor protein [Lacinutrix sp. MedPE-SW]|uniref:cell wall anchor protein n=1 Tax=Lacinutrix sp. MedPE-SW TaxID=1860087 RepID=UPI00091BD5D8|nr:cell wall anchor protein [Lacinutrix sp. MedPE-SW]OIQ21271.1 MAG: hypothetical protein BM549_09870 [Lacinutrix sp. MedPE-SW]